MTIKTISDDSPVDALVALVRQLVAFEPRYRMTSAEFVARRREAGGLGIFIQLSRQTFRYDALYIKKQSFWLDLQLIAMSFWITLTDRQVDWSIDFRYAVARESC